jgi:hypothetical protein
VKAKRWADERLERETEEAQRIQTQRVAAQRQRDEQARIEAQQREERLKTLPVELMLGSATSEEIARVKALVASNFPADKYSPERHWRILQEIRALSTKPDWAQRF